MAWVAVALSAVSWKHKANRGRACVAGRSTTRRTSAYSNPVRPTSDTLQSWQPLDEHAVVSWTQRPLETRVRAQSIAVPQKRLTYAHGETIGVRANQSSHSKAFRGRRAKHAGQAHLRTPCVHAQPRFVFHANFGLGSLMQLLSSKRDSLRSVCYVG